MKLALISNDNGWGLSKDTQLLTTLLANQHAVTFQQWDAPRGRGRYDINLHLELVGSKHFRSANQNWLIPNQEWFLESWLRSKGRFTRTLSKTKYGVNVFKDLGFRNVEFLGFTTADVYLPDVPRAFEFIHVAGNSRFKGTRAVINAWLAHPHWPVLHLFNVWADLEIEAKNIDYHFGKVSEKDLRYYQNRSMFHIQPSKAEGFGHVLWEGLAVGAVVITTNAPPMAEIPGAILTDTTGKSAKYNQGWLYDVDLDHLIANIEMVINMDKPELITRQTAARNNYLTNDKEFKKRLYAIFK